MAENPTNLKNVMQENILSADKSNFVPVFEGLTEYRPISKTSGYETK